MQRMSYLPLLISFDEHEYLFCKVVHKKNLHRENMYCLNVNPLQTTFMR